MMNPEEQILNQFEAVSAIPRGTGFEAGIRQWLMNWAAGKRLLCKVDAIGNLVVYVPAGEGLAHLPAIILQCHLDMVWQKTPESRHNFQKDPIRMFRDGDWLRAGGTTLGADNGIAIALIMNLVEDQTIRHPPLEILFTVQEESGVVGASQLDPGLLSGRSLINLDSEKEGAVTVGCIGGGDLTIRLPVKWQSSGPLDAAFKLTVKGLKGGHSGEDIHKHRLNANKILAEILSSLQELIELRLHALQGGNARNAIPREAGAVFVCRREQSIILGSRFRAIEKTVWERCVSSEPGISIDLSPVVLEAPQVIPSSITRTAIQLLNSLPQGVDAFYQPAPEFVETSNNIGIVELHEEFLSIVSNNRSLLMPKVEALTERMEVIAQSAGASTARSKYVAPWQPDLSSSLLQRCNEAYQALFRTAIKINLSHGGLESGIISERCGGLDAVSIGPTIEYPHSPDECLFIPSLERTWKLIRALVSIP